MSTERRRLPWLQGWHVTLVCLVLAAAVAAPYASELDDGFEAAMKRLGLSVDEPNVNPAPLSDYSLPGGGSVKARTFGAVVIGMLSVFALAYGTAKVLERRANGGHTGSELPVPHGTEEDS